jgi:ribosomal protein S18 acetylase RimI-like enzyme
MFSIRPAVIRDIDLLCELDPIAHQNDQRRTFIKRSVEAGYCSVIETQQRVVGYAVLDYSFYEQGFVSMLYVHAQYRGQGAGLLLMRHLETICQTRKLFTSTNLSNLPMQSLLVKLGYSLAGVIHHLDEDDPELVYVKWVATVPK